MYFLNGLLKVTNSLPRLDHDSYGIYETINPLSYFN